MCRWTKNPKQVFFLSLFTLLASNFLLTKCLSTKRPSMKSPVDKTSSWQIDCRLKVYVVKCLSTTCPNTNSFLFCLGSLFFLFFFFLHHTLFSFIRPLLFLSSFYSYFFSFFKSSFFTFFLPSRSLLILLFPFFFSSPFLTFFFSAFLFLHHLNLSTFLYYFFHF